MKIFGCFIESQSFLLAFMLLYSMKNLLVSIVWSGFYQWLHKKYLLLQKAYFENFDIKELKIKQNLSLCYIFFC